VSFHELWKRQDFEGVSRRIRATPPEAVRLALARPAGTLTLDDLAALLSPAAGPFLEELAARSQDITRERFGRTMQLYAPLYLTNVCANVCTYCGFSAQNRIPRKALDEAEVLAEAKALKGFGFDHVLLVTGESARYGRDYLARMIRLLRPRFCGISMEVQPLPTEDYRFLADEGLSAVYVYQETYHAPTYAKHHLSGPKADISFRLDTPDRLGEAGIKKIGLGALYGLADWRAEAWFLGLHLQYLERRFWRARYSLSFPRLRPHEGGETPVAPFTERDLVQAACAFRLFDREVELSLSTRERAEFRDRAFSLGFTAMSAGSRTNPGGYAGEAESLEQFAIDDDRAPGEVAAMLRARGCDPVWKDWDPTYDGHTPAGSPASPVLV